MSEYTGASVAALTRAGRGPGLGGAHHDAGGAHGAVVGDDRRGAMRGTRVLSRATRAPRRATTSARPRARWAGLDRRAVRGERGADHAGRPTCSRGAVGVERGPLVAEAEPRPRDVGAARSRCGAVRATTIVPPLAKSQSMPSAAATRRPRSTVSLHGPAHGARGRPVAPGQRGVRGGEQRRAPAAVAPGGPEAGHLRLDDGDAQGRVGLEQVVRGPQPGETRADDADVDLGVAGERRRSGSGSALVAPERDLPGTAHSRAHASVSTSRRMPMISSNSA